MTKIKSTPLSFCNHRLIQESLAHTAGRFPPLRLQCRLLSSDVCEPIHTLWMPGSGMHVVAYFKGNKDRHNMLTDMLFSICGVAI